MQKRTVLAIVVVAIIAVLAIAGFFVCRYFFESEKVDVSGWQTYKNDQYGFEFKYPPMENGENLVDGKNNYYLNGDISNSGISFGPWEDKKGQPHWSVDVQEMKKEKCLDLVPVGTNFQDITIDNVRGKKIQTVIKWDNSIPDSVFYTRTIVCLEKGDFIYIFYCTHWGEPDDYDYSKFDYVLSTFKFTK